MIVDSLSFNRHLQALVRSWPKEDLALCMKGFDARMVSFSFFLLSNVNSVVDEICVKFSGQGPNMP